MTEAAENANPFTALIVDDDRDMRTMVRSFLARHPQTAVLEAADGLEAVDVLLKNRIDLLVVDLHMPRMNGLELAAFVRRNPETREVTIVMFTTEKDVRTRHKAMAQGVNLYVNKPFDPVVFSRIVADLMSRRGRP